MFTSRARRILSGMVVLAVLGLTAATGRQQQTQTVTIVYDANTGMPAASPDTVRVRQGQRLQWTSAYRWRVNIPQGAQVFGAGPGKAPGPGRTFSGGANQSAGGPVLPTAATRGYKYSVSVFVGEQWRTRDPEIVVIPAGR